MVFVPELPKLRIGGAARWFSPRKALIQLSLRYKTNDPLRFSFFHEAGHMLLQGKRSVFIDDGRGSDGKEARANAFAADFLVPPATCERLRGAGPLTDAAVLRMTRSDLLRHERLAAAVGYRLAGGDEIPVLCLDRDLVEPRSIALA